jgi:hypothetical protein
MKIRRQIHDDIEINISNAAPSMPSASIDLGDDALIVSKLQHQHYCFCIRQPQCMPFSLSLVDIIKQGRTS